MHIAMAIITGTCLAMSDGSFKDSLGTMAWILMDTVKAKLFGSTTVPGSAIDQGSFHRELAGIYSTICMANHVCKYYSIQHGSITFGCNGLSALQQCFNKHWHISQNTPDYNLISAIQMALVHSPIKWQWCHIHRHQDQVKHGSELLPLKSLHIQMDTNAKQWWENLSQAKHQPIPAAIPGKGWTIYLHQCKLATFNEFFNSYIQ